MAQRRIGTIIAPVLRIIVAALSPVIHTALENAVRSLFAHAQETENDIDNVFVELLADLLDIDL